MFHDLDATLAALLEAELLLDNVGVTFAAPDEQFPPSSVSLPAVAFFLYELRENWELKRSYAGAERGEDGSFTRSQPPKRIDCSYLITAWPSPSASDPAQDEHRMLGEVMKVLLRYRKLPGEYLRGELVGHEPPVRAKVLSESQLRSLGEFWQAMGGKPKATLHYGITLSVDVFEPEEVGPVVTEKRVELSHETGRIRQGAGQRRAGPGRGPDARE